MREGGSVRRASQRDPLIYQPYYSSLNPIFLAQAASLAELNTLQKWIIRDGTIPLRRFFKRYPTPTGLRSVIFIEASLAKIIPEAWNRNIGTFTVCSLVDKDENKTRECLIIGTGNRRKKTIEEIGRHLAKLDLESTSTAKKTLVLPFMNFSRLTMRDATTLRSYLGDFTTRPKETFNFQASFKGIELLEISPKHYCIDSYFRHLVLSRGGQLSGESPPSKGKIIPISPYHAYAIIEPRDRHN